MSRKSFIFFSEGKIKKKILIIGGTYFLGKAFAELMLEETDAELVLLHRGTAQSPSGESAASESSGSGTAQSPTEGKDMALVSSGRVREYLADRHDISALRNFSMIFASDGAYAGTGNSGQVVEETPHFDAIVDFCAYAPGDIATLMQNINSDADRYIFISTCDVYERGTGKLQNEDAPLEYRDFGGEAGAYISGKVALEKEIAHACERKGCDYTVLRPASIYGPGNYAPREGMYFHWIDNAGQIIHPADADGEFQLVFVKDVAQAIKLVLEKDAAKNQCYNVCSDIMYTYDSFASLLEKATEKAFEKAEVTVADINAKGIPLPFPLTKAETNHYDGSKLNSLGMKYTDDVTAMRNTYLYSK